jgi:DNA polymerase-3 subunit epsilon
MCPCDGTQSEVEYGAVVERLIHGIVGAPHILLDPLVHKMGEMANERRFEEAGWLRDRHDALARSLDLRRSWVALMEAGVFEVEIEDASRVVIDHGCLVESRRPGEAPSLSFTNPTPLANLPEVPANVQQAEEATTIWRWLVNTPIRIIESTGSLSLPINPVTRLDLPARNAA